MYIKKIYIAIFFTIMIMGLSAVMLIRVHNRGKYMPNIKIWSRVDRYTEQNKILKKRDNVKEAVAFIGNSIMEIWVNNSPDFFRPIVIEVCHRYNKVK